MANVRAVHSIGESIRSMLQVTYPAELAARFPCDFQVVSIGQLAQVSDPTASNVTITLFLYRTTVNDTLRNRRVRADGVPVEPVLALDLHWMVSVWASSPEAELTVFAWVQAQLHRTSVLDGALLSPDGGWQASEMVQLVPHDLPIDEMLRIWESLEPSYRLSTCYLARTVLIELTSSTAARPVVAVRRDHSDEGGA